MEKEEKLERKAPARAPRREKKAEKGKNEPQGNTGVSETGSPKPATSKGKGKSPGKSKPRRRKSSNDLKEEDIIDGFAIMSFESFDDLEAHVMKTDEAQKKVAMPPCTVTSATEIETDIKPPPDLEHMLPTPQPTICKMENSEIIQKIPKNRVKTPPTSSKKKLIKNKMNQAVIENCKAVEEPNTPVAVKIEPPSSPPPLPQVNVDPKRSNSRDRLSDASTHTNSEKGYIGDSESGDDRASDVGSDNLFTTATHSRENNISSSCSSSSTASTPVINGPSVATIRKESAAIVSHNSRPSSEKRISEESEKENFHSTHYPHRFNRISNEHKETPTWGSSSSANLSHSVTRHLTPTPTPTERINLPISNNRHTPTYNHSHTPVPAHTPRSHTPLHSHTPHHSHTPNNMFAPPIPPPPPLTSTSLPLSSSLSAGSFGPGTESPMSFHTNGVTSSNTPVSSLHAYHTLTQQQAQRPQFSGNHATGPFLSSWPRGGPLPSSYDPLSIYTAALAAHKPGFMRHPLPPNEMERDPAKKFEKFPPTKIGESPFYRHNVPGLPASYPGLPPMHLTGPTGVPGLGSAAGLHGAFQPKSLSNMHHAQLLLSFGREREERNAQAAGAAPSGQLPPPPKRSGKWCAVHVRIAWEIYHHQQKQQADAQKNPDSSSSTKPPDPLRPPGTLLPSHRPPEVASAPSLLPGSGSHSRSPFESGPHHSFLNAMGVAPFARPGPYAGLGFAAGLPNGMLSSREHLTVPGLTSPHEWNRLHRTPPSFPTAPGWPKTDLEKEREKERELLLGKDKRDEERILLDREREQRERERRTTPVDRRPSSEFERSRERDRTSYEDQRRRSRSRSPLRNGQHERREYGLKPDSAFNNLHHDKNELRVKDERRDDDVTIVGSIEREKRNDFLTHGLPVSHPLSASSMLADPNRRLLTPYAGLASERPPNASLWNPLTDRIDVNRHRLELQQELERERERELLRRFRPVPGHPMLEHDRLKEQHDIFMREREREIQRELQERAIRDYEMRSRIDLMHQYEREREHFDRSKIPPPLRPDHFTPTASGSIHFPGPRGSPNVVNHNSHNTSKNSSPATSVGAPPPLIPSSANALNNSHSHSNSPTMNGPTKSKSNSPLELASKERREANETRTNEIETK